MAPSVKIHDVERSIFGPLRPWAGFSLLPVAGNLAPRGLAAGRRAASTAGLPVRTF